MLTNAERIAEMVKTYGSKSVLIHEIPGTRFWLVMYKSKKSWPNWSCVLCDPFQTTWKIVAEDINDSEYDEIWKSLLKQKIQNLMKK